MNYKPNTLIFALITCSMLLINTGCSTDGKTPDNTVVPTIQTIQPSEIVNTSEVACDWTLAVNDTATTKVNGYDFICTLNVNATKIGGKSDLGAYGGSITISYEYDMQNQGVAGNAAGSGEDPNVVIEMVSYEVDKYSDYGENGPSSLTPLTAYDSMALGDFNITGTGFSNESAGGAEWSTQETQTVVVPYKIAIEGGQAVIELPSIAPGLEFKGTLTGTPDD